jgi:hypothetical protein
VGVGLALLGLIAGALAADRAVAATLVLPSNVGAAIVSDEVPTALAPANFTVDDFTLDWVGEPLPDVTVRLEPGSLEWVRVADVLVLPRARLRVDARATEGGRVQASGVSQALTPEGANTAAALPVALLAGAPGAIEIVVRRDGLDLSGRLHVRFRPRPGVTAARALFDPSCSRFGVAAEALPGLAPGRLAEALPDTWLYVGCRLVRLDGEPATSLLELVLYCDGADGTLSIDGVATPETAPGIWLLGLRAAPGHVDLASGDRRVRLDYRVAERFHRGALGIGVGPYLHLFDYADVRQEAWAPLITVYGSVLLSDKLRLILFDATAVEKHTASDLGVYLHIEWFRFLDRRVSAHLVLGGHVLGFREGEAYHVRASAPQGIELIALDAFARGWNLTAGAFVYPKVAGRLYYNAWLRWGPGAWFVEANYIEFVEPIPPSQLRARSVGLTLGLPLLRFL